MSRQSEEPARSTRSTAGTSAPPFPELFGPTAFSNPPLFTQPPESMSFASGGPGAGEPVPFTSDDRMLLRLVYHQQQALQVQLGTVTSWMQHLSGILGSIDRNSRAPPQPRDSASAPAYGVTAPSGPSFPFQSLSDSVGGGPARGDRRPAPSAATPPTASSSQPPQQHPSAEQRPVARSTASVSGIAGSSSACTPPADSSSAAVNRSVESAAAPWDPTNRRPGQQHGASVRSFGGSSHLAASQENPLLTSSLHGAGAGGGSFLNAPSGSNDSLSNADRSSLLAGGYSASGNVSALLAQAQPRSQPVIARPHSAAAAGPPARALGERGIPAYRHIDRDRAGLGPVDPTATSALLNRSRTRAAPLAAHEAGGSRGPAPAARTGSAVSAAPSVGADVAGPTPRGSPAPSAGGSARHAARRGSGRRAHDGEDQDEALARLDVELETGSLSDGYGSYESRQYMKTMGLL